MGEIGGEEGVAMGGGLVTWEGWRRYWRGLAGGKLVGGMGGAMVCVRCWEEREGEKGFGEHGLGIGCFLLK